MYVSVVVLGRTGLLKTNELYSLIQIYTKQLKSKYLQKTKK